jgi:uncharacterized protein YggU (UPF0235/DUF167 family)
LIALLSKTLQVSSQQIEIISGIRSRHKTVAVRGLDRAQLEECLSVALSGHG